MTDRRSFNAGLALAAAFAAGAGSASLPARAAIHRPPAPGGRDGALLRLAHLAARNLPAALVDALRREARSPDAPRAGAALAAAAAADFRTGRTVDLAGVVFARTELGHWLAAAEAIAHPVPGNGPGALA